FFLPPSIPPSLPPSFLPAPSLHSFFIVLSLMLSFSLSLSDYCERVGEGKLLTHVTTALYIHELANHHTPQTPTPTHTNPHTHTLNVHLLYIYIHKVTKTDTI